MFRYYMTPETRQAVIAESNRLIADRAARAAARQRGEAANEAWRNGGEPIDDDEAAAQLEACGSASAFARLVADLESTAATTMRA